MGPSDFLTFFYHEDGPQALPLSSLVVYCKQDASGKLVKALVVLTKKPVEASGR